MRNLILVLRECPSDTDVGSFVQSLGGAPHRMEDGKVCATLKKGEAAIYVDTYSDPEECLVDVVAAEKILGGPARVCLSVHIGHADGSEELAEEFTISALHKWGGFRSSE